jgi:hypothetical protein
MDNRKISLLTVAAAALLVTIAIPAQAGVPPYQPAADEAVVLTGWLHVEDLTFDQATVQLEVNGEVLSAPISKTGRFDISLPAGTEAVLRFENPGHLSKEVVIDTRYADQGEVGKHLRHVRFAVVLELERRMAGFTYAGSIGNIGFDKDGGCLAIAHTNRLVVGRNNQPMVF